MRVIAGEYKGRPLKAVPGDNTRPTTDKVKESIFNIIGPYFDGGFCFDMFSGSGGLAIEAVSRGIDHAILSEKNNKAIKIIHENIAMTREPEKYTVMGGDSRKNVQKYAQAHPDVTFRLVILDPPYHADKSVSDIHLLQECGLIDSDTTIVCEMDKENTLPDEIEAYYKRKRVEYGTIAVEVFEGK